MKITTGKKIEPRKIVLYGLDGVGKTQWAASAPEPFFIDAEGGSNRFDVGRAEGLESYLEFQGLMSELMVGNIACKTLVLDTADWLNTLIKREVCARHQVQSLSQVMKGYGKGEQIVGEEWDKVLRAFDGLRHNRGIAIIILAHAQPAKVNNPEADLYDQWDLDLHKDSAALVREWADEVLFAGYNVFTKTEDAGFNRERKRAVGNGERVVRTTETPAAKAKNRIPGLPAELPLDFNAYAQYLPRREQVSIAGNIDGIVNNGSSKTPAA